MEGIMLDENKARRVKFWVKFQDLETIRNYSAFNVWKEHWSELLDVPSDFTGGSNLAWFRLHPHPAHPKPWDNCMWNQLHSIAFEALRCCFFFLCNFKFPIFDPWSCQGRRGGWALRIQEYPGCNALSEVSAVTRTISSIAPSGMRTKGMEGAGPFAIWEKGCIYVLDWAIMSRSEKKDAKTVRTLKTTQKSGHFRSVCNIQHPGQRGVYCQYKEHCEHFDGFALEWPQNEIRTHFFHAVFAFPLLFPSSFSLLLWFSGFNEFQVSMMYAFAVFSSSFRFPALPWLLFHPALLPETRTARRILKAGGCRVSRGGFSRQWDNESRLL